MPDQVDIQLCVFDANGQQVAVECVPAELQVASRYLLLRSPTLVQGVARGDQIELLNARTGAFVVLRRSGFLAIQVFCERETLAISAALAELADRLNGFLDHIDQWEKTGKGIVTISVPVSAGFPQIESQLTALTQRHADSSWCYGNVYDTTTDAPLNWWQS